MAGGPSLTCYSFIKHCLCVPERRGERVTFVMNDQRVTSSLLTPNTGERAHTQTPIYTSLGKNALMHIHISQQHISPYTKTYKNIWCCEFSNRSRCSLASSPFKRVVHTERSLIFVFFSVSLLYYFYLITEKSLKRLSFTSPVCHRPPIIKGHFACIAKQSMKEQHQKQLLLTSAEPDLSDNAEELERRVISRDLMDLYAHWQ